MIAREAGLQDAPESIERLWLPEYAEALGQSVRAAERELERATPPGVLDLTYADTKRFPPPSWAVEDLVAAATGSGMTYTPYRGDRGVRAKVAANVSRFLGVEVDPARELLLTPGTQAGLYAALAAIIDPGDRVILPDPDYLATERLLRFLGAEVLRVPLHWEEGEPTLDFDVLQRHLDRRPRLMVLSNPNNPTGAVLDAGVVRRLAGVVRDAGMTIVVDELYSRLVYDGRSFEHMIALEGMRDHVVTLLGPSKTESMSGFRLGVAVAPAAIADRMEDVQSISALRAPAYAQHSLARWLDEDREYVAERIREYQALRDDTVARMNRSGVLEVAPARGTAYMFPRVVDAARADQGVALTLLRDAGVLINPGYQFGSRGAHHFRICFAQDEAVWGPTVDRMIAALS